ncbi:MAG TPA: alpha/beta hydrolase-fold protein [Prolixibacteraceae bacterium]|nr:alpha/beta hydrolase-fold protein [Prolixibacteraceae bacterium]
MKDPKKLISILIVMCLGWFPSAAQFPARNPSINDTLQSVRVSADHRVTFSFFAPKATEVTVGGDFTLGAPAAKLIKSENGVWSYTTNTIPPDSYTYNFSIDGINTLDGKSPNMRENPNSLFNFFDMPSPETDFMALKNVPHGRVESVIYHSNTLNAERRMHVYLPPNFENIKEKLPVLYLLHGGGDNDISWTSAGKINLVLDNLYADGKLKNMIVVMPSGHTNAKGNSMGAGPANDPFCQDFLNDIVPFVEKIYPVSKKREDRAISGFSMGGIQTLNLALWHPEMFGYVFPMGTGFFPQVIKEIEENQPQVLKNPAINQFKVLFIGRGVDDNLTKANNKAMLDLFDKYGIKYKFKEVTGAHSFVFGRRFLYQTFPMMFQ